jgi:hypothetical protein
MSPPILLELPTPVLIGTILVHGICEQKRFAHLDSEIRSIVEGLRRRPSTEVTVEILSGTGATLQASRTLGQGADPSVRVTVVEPVRVTEINVQKFGGPISASRILSQSRFGFGFGASPSGAFRELGIEICAVSPECRGRPPRAKTGEGDCMGGCSSSSPPFSS